MPLPTQLEHFQQSGKTASFASAQPQLPRVPGREDGNWFQDPRHWQRTVRINGVISFSRKRSLTTYVRRRSVMVLRRLILKSNNWVSIRWLLASMDTFKDKQHLEELDQGTAPWKVWNCDSCTSQAGAGGSMIRLDLGGGKDRINRSCLGAHSMILKLAAGTVLSLADRYPNAVSTDRVQRLGSGRLRLANCHWFVGPRAQVPLWSDASRTCHLWVAK